MDFTENGWELIGYGTKVRYSADIKTNRFWILSTFSGQHRQIARAFPEREPHPDKPLRAATINFFARARNRCSQGPVF
jgi:hypothetical protein